MSDLIRVRDRAKGTIRTITRQAYMAMGPKVYEKLGSVDQTTESAPANVHRAVSATVIMPQIKAVQEQVPEPEQSEEPAQAEPETEVAPKRRGRKPGVKNQNSSVAMPTEK